MNRFRFSIASLIAYVGFAATGFAAIRVASPAWAGGLCSLAILAMLTSILGIVSSRPPKRDYWVGFAIFGWTHLLLAFAPWFSTYVGPELFGAKLLKEFYPILHPGSANAVRANMININMGGMGGMGGMSGTGMGPGMSMMGGRMMGGMGSGRSGSGQGGGAAPTPAPGRVVSQAEFLQIGQSLETLLWAFLGGWIASYLSLRRMHRIPGQQLSAPDPSQEPSFSE